MKTFCFGNIQDFNLNKYCVRVSFIVFKKTVVLFKTCENVFSATVIVYICLMPLKASAGIHYATFSFPSRVIYVQQGSVIVVA